MTWNILDDSSFRADLPFFGGERIIRENGKPGNANKAVIDKLVEVGKLLARKPHHDLRRAFLALEGARDPPEPPAMVRGHRRGSRRRQGHHGTTIRQRALRRSTSW
jgi:isoleucyl-tRNA synthetase